MQQTTKIYENTTAQPVNVLGVGVIQPHDRISITAEYHAPVNLANYPGVIDVLAEEAAGTLAEKTTIGQDMAIAGQPAQTAGMQTSLEAQKVEE